jgi:hypothetical protein
VQEVSESCDFAAPTIDLGGLAREACEPELRRLALEEAQRAFDLAQGPLLRFTLLRLGEAEHVALYTLHHIVADGWSMGVLIRELGALYQARLEKEPYALPALPVQYGDFALWQRSYLQGEVLEQEISYWREALRGIPVLDLATDRPRPPIQTARGALCRFTLPAVLSAALARLSRSEGVTLFMTLFGAFMVLLSRATGQEDVAVGSVIANRTRREIEGLIGFFVNTLVLRGDVSGNPDFRQMLRRSREVSLSAFAHQDLPFEKVVEQLAPQRDASRTPLFQVVLALQNTPREDLVLPGLQLTAVETESRTAKFDLTLTLNETAAGLLGSWEYNRDLFDATTPMRLAAHFEVLLGEVAADPGRRVSDLPFLTSGERAQLLVEWNDTDREVSEPPLVHELFAAHARKWPQATALAWPDGVLTYGDLDRRADRLARRLRGLGVGPDVLVALCTERTSPERVVGIVAVLKAGGAYVSLDPT